MWLAIGGTVRELRDGDMVVGSGADADWRVPTADLMPRHFTLTVYGLNAMLKPWSKDNVIAVNGKQVVGQQLLKDGDVVLAGAGRFLFSDETPRAVPDDPTPARALFLINETASVAHELRTRSTTIGRDASNVIVVPDSTASRFHAEIRREAGGFALHSMGSAGTTLNGRVLEGAALLGDGDRIGLAYTNFRFAETAPEEMPREEGLAPRRSDSRRNRTLATGKISVVPGERPGIAPLILGVALILAIALAFVLSS
jgi:pSer/pThr/pTyr-binding forkhead associated (FHA) protein